MHAMILAAGRGERMRPLTDTVPKPLLEIDNKPLIQHQVERLAENGITHLVINHGHMGEQIESCLGDGKQFGVNIQYSAEQDNILETGGGMLKALPLLGDAPFIAVNADIWTDYPYLQLPDNPQGLAHLVLVNNPAHHPDGDFALQDNRVNQTGATSYTFAGIGVYRPELFSECPGGAFPLAPLLRQAMANDQVTGEHYQGEWMDIGTPERLENLRRSV